MVYEGVVIFRSHRLGSLHCEDSLYSHVYKSQLSWKIYVPTALEYTVCQYLLPVNASQNYVLNNAK